MNTGCYNEDHLVDRYTLVLVQENSQLKTDVALRDENEYTQKQQLCVQEVTNQKTSDSIQIVNERLQCFCESIDSKIAAEAAARKCEDEKLEQAICCESKARKQADNSLVSYMNSTFYAKQVCGIQTGGTATAQILYNPLPIDDCCC